jgi:tetratricopeptide (TPR) repeat protein
VIRPAQGAERRYAAERVVEVQTSWPAGYEEGIRLLRDKDYGAAEQRFLTANQAEQRPWVRRIILGELARALLRLGRNEQAAEVVLAILGSDATSRDFHLLPLAWASDAEVPQARAEAWMSRTNDAAANLLGASYLLSTARRPDAVTTLQRLTSHADPRVAAWAEAQLWRTSVATAGADQAQAWQAAIEKMPREMRAGPSFVVGQLLRRLGRHDEAALALLRVPIHAPEHAHLAARALLDAAMALNDAGQPQEALRLAREVVSDYASTPSAKPAEEFIRRLETAR